MRRASRNSVWILSGRLATQAFSLAFVVFAARELGTDRFGQYSLAVALASYLSIGAAFGIDLHAIREMARDPWGSSEVFTASMLTRALLWACGMLTLLPLAFLLHQAADVRLAVGLMAAGTLFSLLGSCGLAVLSSREEFAPRVIVEASTNLLRVALGYAALRGGLGVPGIAGAMIVSSFCGALAGLALVRRRRVRFLTFRWRLVGTMLRRSASFGVAGILFALYFRMNVMLLPALLDDHATGLYAATFKVVDLWILIPGSVAAAIYPILSRAADRSGASFTSSCRLASHGLLAVTIPFATLLAFDAGRWIDWVYGPDYATAGPCLAILVACLPLLSLNHIAGGALYALGRARQVLLSEAIGLAASVAAALLLIPRAGLRGAALAAVATQALVVGRNLWLLRDRFGAVVLGESLLPAVPAAFLAAAIVGPLGAPPLPRLFLGGAIYATIWIALGGIRPIDREWLAANAGAGRSRRLLERLGWVRQGDCGAPGKEPARSRAAGAGR